MKAADSMLSTLLLTLTISNVHAYNMPANVKAFPDRVKSGQCTAAKSSEAASTARKEGQRVSTSLTPAARCR